MQDFEKPVSWAAVLWVGGAVFAASVSASFAIMQIVIDSADDRINAFTARFESDIDQHDKRIANNGDTLRAVILSLGVESAVKEYQSEEK